jgi:hypothetical protein
MTMAIIAFHPPLGHHSHRLKVFKQVCIEDILSEASVEIEESGSFQPNSCLHATRIFIIYLEDAPDDGLEERVKHIPLT